MKRIIRPLMAFILLISFMLAAGCAVDTAAPVEEFYSKISAGDYAGAYNLLSDASKEKITLEEFSSRHSNIFSALELSSITVTNIEPDASSLTPAYTYSLTYSTRLAGDITNNYSVSAETASISFPGFTAKEPINWSPSMVFPQMDWGDTVRISNISAPRGEIFSSDGKLLAGNGYATTFYASLSKTESEDAFADAAANLLDMEKSEIIEALNSKAAQRDGFAIIKTYLPKQTPENIEEAYLEIPGGGVDKTYMTPVRVYPEYSETGLHLSHTLGYVGAITEKELETYGEDYDSSDVVGKQGIEAAYESTLRGKDGFEVNIISQDNAKKATLYSQPPQPGLDVWLTIDSSSQLKAEKLLDEHLKEGESGVVIVMDPYSGSIDAIASHPSFSPYLFSSPISQSDWEELNAEDGGKPLFNRSTQGLYPPGSIIKPFTAAAAIETGTLGAGYVFTEPVTGNKWIPSGINWVYPPITRKTNSGSPLDMTRAMVHSDNIYFAFCALKTGSDNLISRFNNYGFGEAVPFDTGVAAPSVKNEGTEMNPSLLAASGFGQGELLITPLQMASMYSAICNGGTIAKPHVVGATYKMLERDYVLEKEILSEPWRTNVIDQQTIYALAPMLEKVVSEGTGYLVNGSGSKVAGKTGTAEIGHDKSREISWFVGYHVEREGRKLVLVMLDVPEGEGRPKFDISREMFRKKDTGAQNNGSDTQTSPSPTD
ncbi:MAG: penicillin-binding transpeptidase domain-containing protein [Christensenellales bacterium]|jgi:cell division protein FtsI/penicillin-binding protein 2